jgi:hypothetical protein
MEMVISDAFNGTKEVSQAGNFPLLRFFTVQKVNSSVPLTDVGSKVKSGNRKALLASFLSVFIRFPFSIFPLPFVLLISVQAPYNWGISSPSTVGGSSWTYVSATCYFFLKNVNPLLLLLSLPLFFRFVLPFLFLFFSTLLFLS